MTKKGDVWVSAVMYIGLGVAILAIILTAGMPVINKVRDKNVALQTKDIMLKLDETIRTTLNEGPGSKRTLSIEIGKGDFTISGNEIKWIFKTTVLLSQPGTTITEGNLNIETKGPLATKDYESTYTLDYSDVAELKLDIQTLKIMGRYSLIIMNEGVNPSCTTNCLPEVSIKAI